MDTWNICTTSNSLHPRLTRSRSIRFFYLNSFVCNKEWNTYQAIDHIKLLIILSYWSYQAIDHIKLLIISSYWSYQAIDHIKVSRVPRCESGIPLVKWKVTWNMNYSPFKIGHRDGEEIKKNLNMSFWKEEMRTFNIYISIYEDGFKYSRFSYSLNLSWN